MRAERVRAAPDYETPASAWPCAAPILLVDQKINWRVALLHVFTACANAAGLPPTCAGAARTPAMQARSALLAVVLDKPRLGLGVGVEERERVRGSGTVAVRNC